MLLFLDVVQSQVAGAEQMLIDSVYLGGSNMRQEIPLVLDLVSLRVTFVFAPATLS